MPTTTKKNLLRLEPTKSKLNKVILVDLGLLKKSVVNAHHKHCKIYNQENL